MKYLLATLLLAMTLPAMATVATPDADWWQATTVYTVGDIVEVESLEQFFTANNVIGGTNIGYYPPWNPTWWTPSGNETETPEPGTLLLVGAGILAFGIRRWNL